MAKKVIKGIDKVLAKMAKFGDEAKIVINETTEANANEINVKARQLAPKDKGKLAQSIYVGKVGELTYSINVGLEYGAYIEFGTGTKVSIPTELAEEAAKFRNRGGSFKDGLQSIKDWCRSKGIPEEAAYPIFMSILNKGITPQPFLYPAFVSGRKQYLKDLKADLKYLTDKFNKK